MAQPSKPPNPDRSKPKCHIHLPLAPRKTFQISLQALLLHRKQRMLLASASTTLRPRRPSRIIPNQAESSRIKV